jgi:hypothetical protein
VYCITVAASETVESRNTTKGVPLLVKAISVYSTDPAEKPALPTVVHALFSNFMTVALEDCEESRKTTNGVFAGPSAKLT